MQARRKRAHSTSAITVAEPLMVYKSGYESEYVEVEGS